MPHPLTPVPTPETQPFWDGLSNQHLRITRCGSCTEAFFPPSTICPHCSSTDVEWFEASGDATLYSFVIQSRPLPMWDTSGPRSVALVRLAEGPMLVSSVVNCPQTPEALQLDMSLRATFESFADTTVLCFEPEGTST